MERLQTSNLVGILRKLTRSAIHERKTRFQGAKNRSRGTGYILNLRIAGNNSEMAKAIGFILST